MVPGGAGAPSGISFLGDTMTPLPGRGPCAPAHAIVVVAQSTQRSLLAPKIRLQADCRDIPNTWAYALAVDK